MDQPKSNKAAYQKKEAKRIIIPIGERTQERRQRISRLNRSLSREQRLEKQVEKELEQNHYGQ